MAHKAWVCIFIFIFKGVKSIDLKYPTAFQNFYMCYLPHILKTNETIYHGV